jgi:endoglucanase
MSFPWLKKVVSKIPIRHPLVIAGLAIALLASIAFAIPSVVGEARGNTAAKGPLRSAGGEIVDPRGGKVVLTGVNWFGFETGTYAPHGLWARKWGDMLDQMAKSGFNTIRLPYSNALLDPSTKPDGIDPDLNPDLVGLNGSQLLDKIVNGATDRGLMVILDRHRPTAEGQSELWYTDKVSEERWIGDWVSLAQRYKNNPLVIGADLHNEPRGNASWGDGNKATDWRLAAERAGNAILAANPNWLIFVEGVEKYKDEGYWWGGNLQGAKENPVRLSNPNKLVYSAHDYGPGVWRQSWFDDPAFPENLPKIWDHQWAYLAKDKAAPLLLGEFGGRSVGQDTEGKWQRRLMQFLKERGISYTYWSWNPNSGDTGGVLKDDWTTVDTAKLAVINGHRAPMRDGSNR